MFATRALMVAVLLLPAQANALLSIKQILASQTKTEKALTSLAADLAKLPKDEASVSRSDRSARRIWDKGQVLWQKSSANSGSTYSVAGSGAYEINILVQGMVNYYVMTGRTGLAIPVLEAAVDESYGLRYYSFWQRLSFQLVEYYQRLGMIDHARARLETMVRFMKRLQLDLDHLPEKIDFDTVALMQMHALLLELRPDTYDRDQVDALYALFLRSINEGPEHWGWNSRDGFRYVSAAPAFVLWYARFSSDVTLARSIADYIEISARSRETDPLRLADELDINFMNAQLGRDIFSETTVRTSELLDFKQGLFEWADPEILRYRDLAPFKASLVMARAYATSGKFDNSMQAVQEAEKLQSAIDAAYARIPAEYRALDQLSMKKMSLVKVRARVLEGLGRTSEALEAFDAYIAWSETERDSVPLDQRQHFFRGQAREAYIGAIRTQARRFQTSPTDAQLEALLARSEQLRARQFQEALGRGGQSRTMTLAKIRDQLTGATGILVLQDLESEVMTIFLSATDSLVTLFSKPVGWDARVFALRNQLAERAEYDTAGFNQLGHELLGGVSELVKKTDRLFVLTDGVVSVLPPTILPYARGQLLSEARAITLLPSLSLWLEGQTSNVPSQREDNLLVLADPVFDESTRVSAIGRDLMSTRGGSALKYFSRLPETRDEGNSILSRFRRGKMLAGEDAVESLLKAEPLNQYTHLHFATHGIISNDLPGFTEPALVLGHEPGEDGFLFASEVVELNLSAELTVLSACNTGNGEYFNGEGLMGMGRAFMLAGSKQVIVSLWPVESYSTQRLMEHLYAFMEQGMPADVALWNAQRRLRGEQVDDAGQDRGITIADETLTEEDAGNDYNNPYFWSPFLLIANGHRQLLRHGR